MRHQLYQQTLGSGPSVLFVHGWLHSGDVWSTVADALSGYYRTTSIDLPGFGRSPPLAAQACTLRSYAHIVQACIASLCEKYPCHCAVGDSLGAILLLQAVAADHGAVSRLMLSGCPVDGLAMPVRALAHAGVVRAALHVLRRAPTALADAVVVAACRLSTVHRISSVNAAIIEAVRYADPRTAELLLRQLCLSHQSLVPNSGWITPTVVARGQFDSVVSAKTAKWLSQQLNATYIELPSSGHTPMVERPVDYCSVLRDLLDNDT
ncbi:MAG: alpha/beta hydrolase [Planctomycetota bacterium]